MRFNRQVIWSIVEEEWLKLYRDQVPLNQMTIYLSKSRNAITNKLKEFDGKTIKKPKKQAKAGKAPDLGNIFMRSGWERDCARWFNHQGWNDWIYEHRVYVFDNERRGAISYLPDFYIPSQNILVEIKGYLDSKGRSSLKKFKRYYPDEFKKLRAITGSPNTKASKDFEKIGIPIVGYMSELKKQYRDTIPHWETR